MRDPSEGSLKRRSGVLPRVIAQTGQIVLVSKHKLNQISHRRCCLKPRALQIKLSPAVARHEPVETFEVRAD